MTTTRYDGPAYGQTHRVVSNSPPPKAQCKLRGLMVSFRDFVRHIAECKHPECAEILRNHIQLCDEFGVEFHPPAAL